MSEMPDIYHYDPETFEFLSSSKAKPDPLDGEPRIPRHATTTVPPAAPENQVAVYEDGVWSLREDHRGKTVYQIEDREPLEIKKIGPLPENVTEKEPGRLDEWNGSDWVPNIEAVRDAKLQEVRMAADTATEALKAPYSQTEILTWERQERQARAFMEDSQSDTPLMDELASKRGLTRQEMAQKIITKADTFEALAAEAIGTQQALEDTVKAATTVAEIEAVEWPE